MSLTWRQLWVETADRLGGDALAARWMCEQLSGTRGLDWVAALDDPVGRRAVAQLDAFVARRLAGEPLQYVLGTWSFRRLELLVDRRVLIPRPETEFVAQVALDLAESMPRPITIADLGTGSGAIGLSLAVELPATLHDGDVSIWLGDVSPDALDVARANLAGIGRRGTRVRVGEGSWFAALPDERRGALDLVVSNPPYIAADDPEVEPAVRDWEPDIALFADDDGLAAHRALADGARSWLRPGGAIVLEIGHGQRAAIVEILDAAGFCEVEVRLDLAGRDRVAVARRPVDG